MQRGVAETPSEQITEILRARIESGQYPPRSKLPSRLDLKNEFGVAPETVAKAVKALEVEGLVVTRRNYGTFVLNRPS